MTKLVDYDVPKKNSIENDTKNKPCLWFVGTPHMSFEARGIFKIQSTLIALLGIFLFQMLGSKMADESRPECGPEVAQIPLRREGALKSRLPRRPVSMGHEYVIGVAILSILV